jgi:hypothetical protein
LKRDYSYDINLDKEGGRTSFYASMDKLLVSDFVEENDTLTAVINGRDNVGKVSVEKVVKDANNKNVVVNILGIGIDDEYAQTLMEITSKTKGNYYFVSKSFSSKVF